jgi:hypothetical protein
VKSKDSRLKNDGTDANLYDIENRDSEYTIYPFEEIKVAPDKQFRKL